MNQQVKALLFLLLILPQLTYSQKGKLEIGMEGGLNWSNLSKERFKSDYKRKIYGAGGITIQYHFSKFFSLKTAVNYEARGFSLPMTLTYPDHIEYPWFSTRFDFLTIPLMGRVTIGSKVRFFFNAGGYFGFAMDKSGHLEGDDPGFNKLHLTYLKDYKKRDAGLLAGIGISVPLNDVWALSLEARGTIGFADFTESNITRRWEGANVLFGVSHHVKPKDPENTSFQNNRITIGISGGPNCTFARGETSPGPNYTFKTYPNAGSSYELALQWNFKRRLSIRSGLLYEQKSVVCNTYYTSPGWEQLINHHLVSTFDYLTIPVLAKLTFGKKVQFFCNAGFFISILNKQQDQIKSNYALFVYPYTGYEFSTTEVTQNNRTMYKKTDSGLSGGIGMGIPIKKRFCVSAEWRQNYGMKTIFNLDNWKGQYTGIKNGRLLTNSMGFLVGISYRLSFRESTK
ncbi:outer membrane beta-barrel protein [Fluviicola chungangensis]|uniref:PorT family protein n=1 Tax=Fluviicola chungangensis TaxID=2597671 RepID=A0A556MJU5_9FLAO|nr:outer membrane beta-barrel protein [Fluviicola chungangensis]TSJ40105.1 PorT family protein [Fluviicola chungangensis]